MYAIINIVSLTTSVLFRPFTEKENEKGIDAANRARDHVYGPGSGLRLLRQNILCHL